jgi:hypothetical protein
VSDVPDRVQDALAAHLEYLELGGAEPDVSHLSDDERRRLQELIALVEQTEGIAFGRGLDRSAADEASASTDAGRAIVTALRDALPPAARIADDPAATTIAVPGMDVAEGWIVGTFGGRIRVWLLASGISLPSGGDRLRDLGRVFRLFPDTTAVALVTDDQSCLLVQPEDCAPTIEVPRGSLVGRRFRRPVQPVGDVVSVFFRELVPHWEPLPGIGDQATRAVELAPIARECAERAIDDQVATGGRARKTNPKRDALTAFGHTESAALAKLVTDVHEGRAASDAVEDVLRKLASKR